MLVLITITFFVGLGLYYVTGIDFEVGDGFTEMKKKAREADYEIVDKKEENKQALPAKTEMAEGNQKMLHPHN